MELIVKISAAVRMVEHVMPYLELAYVHQALQVKDVRMDVHQVCLPTTTISTIICITSLSGSTLWQPCISYSETYVCIAILGMK